MKQIRTLDANRSSAFWWVTLATCIGLLATAALGTWQLSRAAQKEALTAEMSSRAAEAPLTAAELGALLAPDSDAGESVRYLYRQVRAQGQWLSDKTVFLDNRQMDGKQGFVVLTPFQIDGSGAPVVLVQRGWAQRNFEQRTVLPVVVTPSGTVRVSAHLAGAPAQTFSLGSDQPDSGFNRIRQNLSLDAFRAETGLPLARLTLVQTDPDSDGLLRHWAPVSNGVEKHYGYAFQWFALFALILGLYVWFQLIRPRRRG